MSGANMSSENMSTAKNNPISMGMIVLLVSVALNGLLAGVILAKKTNPVPGPEQVGAPRAVSISTPADPRRVLRQLSPERRRAVLKSAMQAVPRKDRQQFRELRTALGKAEQAVFEAASAEDYDPDALRTALQDLSAARAKLGQASDLLLANIWTQLTPAERKTALDAMATRKQRQRKMRRQRRE